MSILPFLYTLFSRLKVRITVDVAESFHLFIRIGRRARDAIASPTPIEDELDDAVDAPDA